jgi:hypothetical protein
MSTTINGDTGIIFPDASTQSKAVSQATPFAVTASAIAGAELQLPEATANGVNYVAVKAPNTLAANTTFTLPAADGTSGQVLQTNASGTLSFGNVAAANGGTGLTSPGTAGNLLTSNGTAWTSAAAPAGVGSSYTEFLASGTWTKPSGITWVFIEAIGGGGGGAGAVFAGAAAGGGGGGGYASRLMLASSLGATETVTIGAGGAGGLSNSGSNGGNSTFGSHVTGPFGLGALGNSTVVQALAGTGNSGFTITVSTNSQQTYYYSTAGLGGVGASSVTGRGGNTLYGGAGGGGTTNASPAGLGGVSQFGGNGGAGNFSGTGTAGSQPGGGGGGSGTSTGGAGGAGRVRVYAW